NNSSPLQLTPSSSTSSPNTTLRGTTRISCWRIISGAKSLVLSVTITKFCMGVQDSFRFRFSHHPIKDWGIAMCPFLQAWDKPPGQVRQAAHTMVASPHESGTGEECICEKKGSSGHSATIGGEAHLCRYPAGHR